MIPKWARPWAPSSADPEWGTTDWTTSRGTVEELVQDILGTHRGQWMGIGDVQSIAGRVRPGINADTVRVEAFTVARSFSSVERRIVCWPRLEGRGRIVTEEQMQLRVQ